MYSYKLLFIKYNTKEDPEGICVKSSIMRSTTARHVTCDIHNDESE